MPPEDISVDVSIRDKKWATHIDKPDDLCARVVRNIVTAHEFEKIGELSIALINDTEMSSLNETYRGKNRPTNVLSFPDNGPAPILGDIAIALETVAREAAEARKDFHTHFTHMLVHGFLHLQGYDHENEADAQHMETLEIAILAKMNIDNPYIIKEPVTP